MTDPIPSNGNGRKAMNRRWKAVLMAVALVTVAFYICMFRDIDIDWFREYADFMSWAVVAIVAGITTTDGIRSWRNGGPKP